MSDYACKTPIFPKDVGSLVPCGKCASCKSFAKADKAGRLLAEYVTNPGKARWVTLTYADPHPGAHEFLKGDVDGFRKWLHRKFPFRYAIAGERGQNFSKRVHWHALFFFRDRVPDLPEMGVSRQMWKYWPHGFTHHDPVSEKTFRYIAKYAVKEVRGGVLESKWLSSRHPPLGHEYFMRVAREHVEAGLVPNTESFTVDGYCWTRGPRKGRPIQFPITGKTRDNFLAEVVRLWGELRPGQIMPSSEPLEKYQDRIAKASVRQQWETLVDVMAAKNEARGGDWSRPYPVVSEVWSTDDAECVLSRDEFGDYRLHRFDGDYECGARLIRRPDEIEAAFDGNLPVPRNGKAKVGRQTNDCSDVLRDQMRWEVQKALLRRANAPGFRRGHKVIRRRDDSVPF